MLDVRYLPEGVASVVCNKLGRMMRNGTLTIFILIYTRRLNVLAITSTVLGLLSLALWLKLTCGAFHAR